MQNICILATDSTITKSYLTVLKQESKLPNEIIYLKIRSLDFLSVKFYKNFAKRNFLRFKKALKLGRKEILFEKLHFQINKYGNENSLIVPDYSKSVPEILKDYGVKFTSLNVKSINDLELVQYIKNKIQSDFILFCGGGILREPLFNTGKKFIHIHPGLVPEIKGSDGILWSALVRKKIGMSAFFMNKGIDTGDIILKKEYKIPQLNLEFDDRDSILVSNKIIEYLDPIYRADILKKLICEEKNWLDRKTEKQDPKSGKTYYFMHPYLKQQAVKNFIAN